MADTNVLEAKPRSIIRPFFILLLQKNALSYLFDKHKVLNKPGIQKNIKHGPWPQKAMTLKSISTIRARSLTQGTV